MGWVWLPWIGSSSYDMRGIMQRISILAISLCLTVPASAALSKGQVLVAATCGNGIEQKLRGSLTGGRSRKRGASSYWCPWGRGSGSGSGGWWGGGGFPVENKGKGEGGGEGWGVGVGTGKGTGKSTRKLCRNNPLAIYPLVSPLWKG